jgi:mycothiol system anti-sigma-R factor
MSRLDRLTCEEMFRRLDDYLDRELTPAEMQQVKDHLENCARCASEYRFDETVLRQVRERLARVQAPAGLLDAIRARLGESPES